MDRGEVEIAEAAAEARVAGAWELWWRLVPDDPVTGVRIERVQAVVAGQTVQTVKAVQADEWGKPPTGRCGPVVHPHREGPRGAGGSTAATLKGAPVTPPAT